MELMPTKEELDRFYEQIYWIDNHYYKNKILIERDLYNYNFLLEKTAEKLIKESVFLNFGAGHGAFPIYLQLGI
jgi:hypothetical protein